MTTINQRYYKGLARVANLPDTDISYAEFDILTDRIKITYGIDQIKRRQHTKTKRAPKKFCEFLNGWGASLFIMKWSEDRVINEYFKLDEMR